MCVIVSHLLIDISFGGGFWRPTSFLFHQMEIATLNCSFRTIHAISTKQWARLYSIKSIQVQIDNPMPSLVLACS